MCVLKGTLTGISLLIASSAVLALPIQIDQPVMNPASTQNLWAYSYEDNASYISSASDFVRASDSFRASTVFQGYVTGEHGPWSNSSDSFGSNGLSDIRSVHVFDTFITSAIDQTVTFTSRGDDGHSIFIDDMFKDGSGYFPTSYTVTASLDMVANKQYKLTFIGNNNSGPFAWWFKTTVGGVGGSVSEAANITMNANGIGAVPEPSTIFLLGAGLLGLGCYGRKHRKG